MPSDDRTASQQKRHLYCEKCARAYDYTMERRVPHVGTCSICGTWTPEFMLYSGIWTPEGMVADLPVESERPTLTDIRRRVQQRMTDR